MLRVVLPLALVVMAEAFAPTMPSSIFSPASASIAKSTRASSLGLRMADTKEPLKTIELKHPNGHSCTVYPFGACVTSYKAPHEVLFCRPDAKFDGSKPISGGVPHCFPQFGPGEIQQHGFARNLDWEVKDVSKDEPDMPSVTLQLTENEETMAMWPNKFKAEYKVGLEEDKMNMELTITNTDDKAWDFQAALHTYFAVSNIDKCEVRGDFKGASFLNKMNDPPTTTKETREAIRFAAETDSVYEGVSGQVVLVDEEKPAQSLTIRNMLGWEDTVLWSPYGNDGMGYKSFACVAPGESWKSMVAFVPGEVKK